MITKDRATTNNRRRLRQGPGSPVLPFGWTLAAALLLVWTAGEAIVRIWSGAQSVAHVRYDLFNLSDDPHLLYEPTPGARVRDVALNQRGFRGTDASPEETRWRLRMAIIGAGFTFGEDLIDDHIYGRIVEARINAAAMAHKALWRLEVVVLGVPGYTLGECLPRARWAVKTFSPDILVLTVGEPYAKRRAEILQGLGGRSDVDAEGVLVDRLLPQPLVFRLLRQSQLAAMLLDRFRTQAVTLGQRPPFALHGDEEVGADWAAEASSLRRGLEGRKAIVLVFEGAGAEATFLRDHLGLGAADLIAVRMEPAATPDAHRRTAEALLASHAFVGSLPEALQRALAEP